MPDDASCPLEAGSKICSNDEVRFFLQPLRYSIMIAQIQDDQVRRSQKGRSQILLFFVRLIQEVGLPMVALE